MKALAAIEPGRLGIVELDMPVPGRFEALVRMDACALCNSTDHKLLNNEFCSGTFPVILGHESVGTVIETGPGVVNFKEGDLVFRQRLGDQHVPGEGRSLWGGFGEYGLVVDDWAEQGVPYGPDSIPHNQQKVLIDIKPELAVGMVTLMECLDCIITCGAAPGKSVAIVGSGPVGQALALFAKLLGAGPVYAFGRNPSHSDRFTSVSKVDGYISSPQLPTDIQSIVSKGGFDIVVEAVGSIDALDKSINLAGDTGQVCVYGVAPGSSPYRPDQMNRHNVTAVGAIEGRVQAKLVNWIEKGQVNLSEWVTHVLPYNDYQKAFDLVESREALKAVLLKGKA